MFANIIYMKDIRALEPITENPILQNAVPVIPSTLQFSLNMRTLNPTGVSSQHSLLNTFHVYIYIFII